MADRPSTPPRHTGSLPPNPLTPEQVRRREEARLKAKALQARADAAAATATTTTAPTAPKRPHSQIAGSSNVPSSLRNAASPAKPAAAPADAAIRPAKMGRYVEYDFSKMSDTRGGFLSVADDPTNRALNPGGAGAVVDPLAGKPAHMSVKEWERHTLLQKLRKARTGPFEPGISVVDPKGRECRDCGSVEIDFQWEEAFGVNVCWRCKDKYPDKYSLLTKTEARDDYLLTDPELKDKDLLPRLEKPNPHKSTWNNMQLYLRFQVEEYAFSAKKWGSPEALDAEFERREADKKVRKEKKFKAKLDDLKKRTRVEAYRRQRLGEGNAATNFGDTILGRNERHEHEWGGEVMNPETGVSTKRCVECGMECEEIEL
ncbi:DNA repair protein [Trichodelitschia bisporula]|uniref:DNA repair protein RAD14 n=1 Tax=Trichodelitschia bisporula TaxID=703511 RepID=A0A6G1I948_9PEZI|nr:DNA repair protein [Trichodelitschia bisporula]